MGGYVSYKRSLNAGVHNSIVMSGQKKIFACYEAKSDMFVHIKECSYERNKLKKIWAFRARFRAFTGHIWPAGCMLCMAALIINLFKNVTFLV